ncbi:hypothetical protein [Streptomyces sp. NRRL S-920]|uniref:hypothetical protein n=1 Tax=Streptomyces sp. NRRL S-920 TaxID=1463921 RepID=UPI00131B1BA5|nr:hypothetical protein [Streptomyces sp. NRRL S-920]
MRFIFVHGTGVRRERYEQLTRLVTAKLTDRFPGARVEAPYWGGDHGATLAAGGASIPGVDGVRGAESWGPLDEEAAAWQLLLTDPLCELRVLAQIAAAGDDGLGMPGVRGAGEEVAARLAELTLEPAPTLPPAPPAAPGGGRASEVAAAGGRVSEVAAASGRVSEAAAAGGRVSEVAPASGRVSGVAAAGDRGAEAAGAGGRGAEVAPAGGRVSEVASASSRVSGVAPASGRVSEAAPAGDRGAEAAAAGGRGADVVPAGGRASEVASASGRVSEAAAAGGRVSEVAAASGCAAEAAAASGHAAEAAPASSHAPDAATAPAAPAPTPAPTPTERTALLRATGLAPHFPGAVQVVAHSAEFTRACAAAHDAVAARELVAVAARAVVAAVLRAAGDDALCTGDERDRLVDLIGDRLGGTGRFPGGRAAAVLGALALKLTVQPALDHWRPPLTGGTVPALGDILRYQARGRPLRDSLARRIAASDEPPVVIGHSLGGIALVDLYALAAAGTPGEAPPPTPALLLVTVGSQAPFLHELGALTGLPPAADRLPPGFPNWLNIYDRKDLLAYRAEPVFPGDPRVTDHEVRSRQPFPLSHSAYWKLDAVYDRIRTGIEAGAER